MMAGIDGVKRTLEQLFDSDASSTELSDAPNAPINTFIQQEQERDDAKEYFEPALNGLVRMLIERQQQQREQPGNEAECNDILDRIRVLLDKGVNVQATGSTGHRPLDLLLASTSSQDSDMMMSTGAVKEAYELISKYSTQQHLLLHQRNSTGQTRLHEAVAAGDFAAFVKLLRLAGLDLPALADIPSPSSSDDNVIISAKLAELVMKELDDRIASLSSTASQKLTLLHQLNKVSWSRLKECDYAGYTLLHEACLNKRVHFIRILLKLDQLYQVYSSLVDDELRDGEQMSTTAVKVDGRRQRHQRKNKTAKNGTRERARTVLMLDRVSKDDETALHCLLRVPTHDTTTELATTTSPDSSKVVSHTLSTDEILHFAHQLILAGVNTRHRDFEGRLAWEYLSDPSDQDRVKKWILEHADARLSTYSGDDERRAGDEIVDGKLVKKRQPSPNKRSSSVSTQSSAADGHGKNSATMMTSASEGTPSLSNQGHPPTAVKRKRGRPRKNPLPPVLEPSVMMESGTSDESLDSDDGGSRTATSRSESEPESSSTEMENKKAKKAGSSRKTQQQESLSREERKMQAYLERIKRMEAADEKKRNRQQKKSSRTSGASGSASGKSGRVPGRKRGHDSSSHSEQDETSSESSGDHAGTASDEDLSDHSSASQSEIEKELKSKPVSKKTLSISSQPLHQPEEPEKKKRGPGRPPKHRPSIPLTTTSLNSGAEKQNTTDSNTALNSRRSSTASNPFKKDKHGRTALHQATSRNSHDLIASLLDQGADIEARDHAGYTALHEACLKGHIESLKVLKSRGAKLDTMCLVEGYDSGTGRTVILDPMDAQTVKNLVSSSPNASAAGGGGNKSKTKNSSGESSDKMDLASLLVIKRGLSHIKGGDTPFHDACENLHTDVVKYLLSRAKTENERLEMVKMRDGRGRLPRECVDIDEEGAKELFELLESVEKGGNFELSVTPVPTDDGDKMDVDKRLPAVAAEDGAGSKEDERRKSSAKVKSNKKKRTKSPSREQLKKPAVSTNKTSTTSQQPRRESSGHKKPVPTSSTLSKPVPTKPSQVPTAKKDRKPAPSTKEKEPTVQVVIGSGVSGRRRTRDYGVVGYQKIDLEMLAHAASSQPPTLPISAAVNKSMVAPIAEKGGKANVTTNNGNGSEDKKVDMSSGEENLSDEVVKRAVGVPLKMALKSRWKEA